MRRTVMALGLASAALSASVAGAPTSGDLSFEPTCAQEFTFTGVFAISPAGVRTDLGQTDLATAIAQWRLDPVNGRAFEFSLDGTVEEKVFPPGAATSADGSPVIPDPEPDCVGTGTEIFSPPAVLAGLHLST